MMKIYLVIVLIMFTPISIYSFCASLIVTTTMMAFMFSHFQDIYLINHMFMWDTISFTLITLSMFISILMVMASVSNKYIMTSKSTFLLLSSMLLLILVKTFSVINIIMFYVMFEASLIPIFMIILGWGVQPERLQAGMYLLIYTVLTSLPLLVVLVLWTKHGNSGNMLLMNLVSNNSITSNLLAILLILAFSVKLPVYLLHLWLPKAHVEAPVAGSMILAAILLKLGSYGVLRVSSKSYSIMYSISPQMISWAMAGGLIVSFICLFQTDIKFLIALSSIAHMALVLSGILTFTHFGINSGQIIMIGHGFCSSGLFFMANMIYERIHSRSLFIFKGLQILLPSLSLMWFLLCVSNMPSPPSLNLMGEILGISSIYSFSKTSLPILMVLVFMSAAFSLYLYSQTQHGKPAYSNHPFHPPSLREWLIIIMHWIPLNFLFLSSVVIQPFI